MRVVSGGHFFQVEHCCPTSGAILDHVWPRATGTFFCMVVAVGCVIFSRVQPMNWLTLLDSWMELWHKHPVAPRNGKIFGWGTSIFIQRPWTCAALGRNLHDLAALLCLTLCMFLKEVVIGSGPGEMKSLAQLFLVRPWVSWFCWLQLVETLGNRQLTLYRRIHLLFDFPVFFWGGVEQFI